MRIFAVTLGLALLTACSQSPSSPPPPDPGAERPAITAAACEAQGGKVVGDIGDGAIHRPEYRCPVSGEPPIGTIVAPPDGPVAIEGAVCCK